MAHARTIKSKRAHTPRVTYTAAELQAHDVADLRIDYVCAVRDARAAGPFPPTNRMELESYARQLAHDVPARLGHTALRQGAAMECATCGASGTATDILIGDLFLLACGERNAGTEATAEECRVRSIREHAQALALLTRDKLGDKEIASGHTRAGVAYERRSKELP